MLSDIRVLQEMERGNIVIEPFDRASLGTNSYDVRLGEWYYATDRRPQSDWVWVDITDEALVRAYWGHPKQAVMGNDDRRWLTIPAGATFLCHTQEIIGGRNGIASEMRARSSLGRSGISVCKCAGIGDVGYINRWTMEITNHSAATVVMPVGLRVAQIIFHEVGETTKQYTGKYGQVEWEPADMLPKLWLDRDVLGGRVV